jgi:hypothetical protein
MVAGPGVDGLEREDDALVLGVAGLPADAALVVALRWWRLGRLDDVEDSLRAAASCCPS